MNNLVFLPHSSSNLLDFLSWLLIIFRDRLFTLKYTAFLPPSPSISPSFPEDSSSLAAFSLLSFFFEGDLLALALFSSMKFRPVYLEFRFRSLSFRSLINYCNWVMKVARLE